MDLLIPIIVFFAALVQSLSGFGFALIVMPLAVMAVGLGTAAPLVAMVATILNAINALRHRKATSPRELVRMTLASAVGVPIGVWALVNVSEVWILRLMGAILILYAVYSLARPKVTRPCSKWWVYPAGFVAGCLGGAYNVPGPPVIIYGSLRQWPRDKFRAVLNGFFFFIGMLVFATHLFAGRVTGEVLSSFLYSIPALILGILLASRIDRDLDRERFRVLVTVMILLLGLSMIIGS